MNAGANKKPTFLWQGILIVAPVLLLAAVGVFAVWKDNVLARHEAAERAQAIADDLLPKLWSTLVARPPGPEHEFEVDANDHLVFPPPLSPTPAPKPFDLAALNPSQLKLWTDAQTAEVTRADPGLIAKAYSEFLKSVPPPEFAAAARYAAALFSAQSGDRNAARSDFSMLLENFPNAVGETGIPLGPLAEVRLLELRHGGAAAEIGSALTVDQVCSNLVSQPTVLSERLLNTVLAQANTPQELARGRYLLGIWQEQQKSRELFALAQPHLANSPPRPNLPFLDDTEGGRYRAGPPLNPANWVQPDRTLALLATNLFWFSGPQETPFASSLPEGHWLANQVGGNRDSRRFLCRSEWVLCTNVAALITASRHIPDYFGVEVELAGRKLPWPASDLRVWHEIHYLGGKGAGQVGKAYSGGVASTVLATMADGTGQLKLNVYLTSPSALYKYQHVRTFWFATLIAAAAVAALVGLIAAYRAFHRQLRLSELKSDFVSSVSHELRAPIASVRLMAESLERGKVSEPARQQEYFHFIDQECRRLSSLIENVLDFSRIEQGRKRYEFEPTDLLALTRHTVQLMETYAEERAVRLKFEMPETAAEAKFQVSADGKALQQALINLIDNALKHSPKGGVVQVGLQSNTQHVHPSQRYGGRASRNTQPGSPGAACPEILLWVEDNGPGIPPSEHEKIFERFYRRGPELRRETQGVGIGLSIVKHIVEAHGGRVVVRSDVGQGSRFTIELPVQNEETNSKEARTGRTQL